MKILMLSDLYHPVIGGLERHVRHLSHELVGRGHSVAVATLQQDGHPASEEDAGIRIYRLSGIAGGVPALYKDDARRFHPTAPDPLTVSALWRALRTERPDVIHAHGWILYSCLPLKRGYTKLVVTLHDYSLVCARKTYLRRGRQVCDGASFTACLACSAGQYGALKGAALTSGLFLSRTLHRRVDRYIAISRAVREATLPAAGGVPVDVIPTFVPDAVFTEPAGEARPEFLPPDDGFLLYVGDMGSHKGLDVLLEAYRAARDLPPLVILGTGSPPDWAQQIPRVSVVRNVPHEQVMAAWRRSVVGVVPSLWAEPLGQVALEAMAAGKPVVASDIGGLRDTVIHNQTGLLVPPGDAAALTQALRSLAHHPELSRRMGRKGRDRALEFRASSVAARTERLYAEVMGTRQ